jgi:hypothetical protein
MSEVVERNNSEKKKHDEIQLSLFKHLAFECGLSIQDTEWSYIYSVFRVLRDVDNHLDNSQKVANFTERQKVYNTIVAIFTVTTIQVQQTLAGKKIRNLDVLKDYFNELSKPDQQKFIYLLKKIFTLEERLRDCKEVFDYGKYRVNYSKSVVELALLNIQSIKTIDSYSKARFSTMVVNCFTLSKLKNSLKDFSDDVKLGLVPNFNPKEFTIWLGCLYGLNLMFIPFQSGITAPVSLAVCHIKNMWHNSLSE